jgi:glucan phosphoethanolaminetransferase (alkaline phosphatase superfamily)
MWQQNFEWERIQSTYVKLLATDDQSVYHLVIYGSLILTLVMGIYWVAKFRKTAAFSFEEVRKFFFGHWLLYILLSYIITGAIISTYRIEQYLYLINFFIILLLINRANGEFKPAPFSFKKAVKVFGAIILFISLLAFILIQTHGELKGSHKRFGEEPAVKDSIAK